RSANGLAEQVSRVAVLEIRARSALLLHGLVRARWCDAGRQRPAHLLELGARGHLLGEQRRLDAMEQALKPADKLRLSNPQLGIAWYLVVSERQGQPFKLVDQLWRQPVFQFLDRASVDLLQPGPALLVKRGGLNFPKQLPDHAPDPHDLCRLLDHLGHRALAAGFSCVALDRDAVRTDHHDLGDPVGLGLLLLSHPPSLSMPASARITGG